MLKNVATQFVNALILDTAGAIVTTGTTTVYITGDTTAQASGGTATHEGQGVWQFAPSQANTNYDSISFLFSSDATNAVNTHLQIYTNDFSTDISAILLDTNELQTDAAAGNFDTATGFATPTNITAATGITVSAMGADTITASAMAVGAIAADAFAAGAIDAAAIATDAIGAAELAADAVTEIQSGLATASALATVDANVDTMVLGLITGAAATGTLSTTEATTDLTGYTTDQLIGRTLTWTSGIVDGEQTDITDYVSTNGHLTYTLMTLAPGNGDTFKIS